MNEDLILQLSSETLRTTAMLSAPLLGAALITGLIVSVFQAVTQINESTLTFIPKMIVISAVLILAGPWMLEVITHFTRMIFENLPLYVRG